MRTVVRNTKNPTDRKLNLNWEDPYKKTKFVGKSAYHLEDLEDKQGPRYWNSNNLRKYYH